MKNNPVPPQTQKPRKPIAFRFSCHLNGSNTGLSHYILLDKQN